jgi:peptidoglycan/xylan/chitin deacetylase (PgdA/CDA1 family)
MHRAARLLLVSSFLGGIGGFAAEIEKASAVGISGVTGTVSASDGGLNLRSGPSVDRRIIRWLPNGTRLSIISTSSDWFKVIAAGYTGWVNSWYVLLAGTNSTVITRGNTSRRRIALTFDAGSDLGYTEDILQILERYGIRASFGITGSWIKAHSDYAAWIAADGHQLLNHTLNHLSYTGASTGGGAISPAKRLAQIQANESLLWNYAGVGSRPYWRPPYGDYNTSVLRDVGALGYGKTVLWTIDTLGWNGYSADQIYQRVIGRAGNGAIVLMHVGSDSADGVALERIIKSLRGSGYGFGTLADVVA